MQTDTAPLLKKLTIHSLLDLALHLPVGYSDNRLSTRLVEGKEVIVEAEVVEAKWHKGYFRVIFYLPRFNIKIASIFFQATAYHQKHFMQGAKMPVRGRLKRFGGMWQLPQPRIVRSVGTIVPKYKVSIKQEEFRVLLKTHLSVEALMDEGLTQSEAALLFELHFPASLEGLFEQGDFTPQVVEKLKFLEAFNQLKKFRKKRLVLPPVAPLVGDIEPLLRRLPFSLTQSQEEAIAHIRSDLSSKSKAARRIIIGDVGAGKTMVILAAAMMAYPKKAVLMAPTTLLARQLFEEAKKYLPDYINCALVTQNSKSDTLHRSRFIIGTHALLYHESLPKCELVMIDEQHRFGAVQRHTLEKMMVQEEKYPHFLQFSATPIPRTQAMIESALIDVTLMRTLPFQKKIQTHIVTKEDFASIFAHIKTVVQKGEQVLIIYPSAKENENLRYHSIEEAQPFWEKHFSGVYSTHGKDRQKEEVLLEFAQKGSILLATTVIEVGISLPKLSLIVIVGAERLGLATLHQLRGRVGRHGQEAHCYLYTHWPQNERLQAFIKAKDGFEIAKLDLQFRKSGDILDGSQQSGVAFRWLDLASDEEIVAGAKARLSSLPKV